MTGERNGGPEPAEQDVGESTAAARPGADPGVAFGAPAPTAVLAGAGAQARLALVALGSNLAGPGGSPAAQVARAMALVTGMGAVAAKSRLWASSAWPPGGPPYVNAALMLRTSLSPDALLGRLHGIEAAFGRQRNERWAARTLDLDLLAVDGLVLPDAGTQGRWRALDPARQGREAPDQLILPHPRLQDRAFVLLPLGEVAPGWRHPLLGLTAAEMLARLPAGAADGVEPLGSPEAALAKGGSGR